MKVMTKTIANECGLNLADFETFLRKSQYKVNYGVMGISIDDSVEDISKIVEDYRAEGALAAEKKAREEKAEEEKRIALANMLITSGFQFDGYTITKYSGYISGDDAVSVERGLAIFGTGTDVKDKLLESLVTIRRNALAELKEAAYALGCNAVIGVDFDYLTLDPQTANLGGGTTYLPYIFGVTANGNAVVIEKNK